MPLVPSEMTDDDDMMDFEDAQVGIEEWISRNPVAAVGGALLAGLLIGRFLL